MRRCAAAGSDARELVQPGARFSVLAVRYPGEPQEAAEDDRGRSAEPEPNPRAFEDHDAEHPENSSRTAAPASSSA